VPSVGAMLFSQGLKIRLLLGWSFGVLASAAGIASSYYLNLPTGAATVCAFGILLAGLAAIQKVRSQ